MYTYIYFVDRPNGAGTTHMHFGTLITMKNLASELLRRDMSIESITVYTPSYEHIMTVTATSIEASVDEWGYQIY